MTFTFVPPAQPSTPPCPCPRCRAQEAVQVYATSVAEYYRCVSCGQPWMVAKPSQAPLAA